MANPQVSQDVVIQIIQSSNSPAFPLRTVFHFLYRRVHSFGFAHPSTLSIEWSHSSSLWWVVLHWPSHLHHGISELFMEKSFGNQLKSIETKPFLQILTVIWATLAWYFAGLKTYGKLASIWPLSPFPSAEVDSISGEIARSWDPGAKDVSWTWSPWRYDVFWGGGVLRDGKIQHVDIIPILKCFWKCLIAYSYFQVIL